MIRIAPLPNRSMVFQPSVRYFDLRCARRLDRLITLLVRRQADLVVDLDQVEVLAPSALDELIGTVGRARRAGGSVVIVRPHGQVLRALQLVGAYPVIFGEDDDEGLSGGASA